MLTPQNAEKRGRPGTCRGDLLHPVRGVTRMGQFDAAEAIEPADAALTGDAGDAGVAGETGDAGVAGETALTGDAGLCCVTGETTLAAVPGEPGSCSVASGGTTSTRVRTWPTCTSGICGRSWGPD